MLSLPKMGWVVQSVLGIGLILVVYLGIQMVSHGAPVGAAISDMAHVNPASKATRPFKNCFEALAVLLPPFFFCWPLLLGPLPLVAFGFLQAASPFR